MLLRSLSRRCTLLILSNLSLAVADDQIENTPDAAIEDVAVLPDGFSPRYYLGASPARQFVKRQDVASCESGEHNCLDLGPLGAGKCCPNSMYCYFQPDWEVGCCGQGEACDPKCTQTTSYYYRWNITNTITSFSTLPSSTGTVPKVIPTLITSTAEACKPRKCSLTAFLCPSQLGGNCCDNGQVCATNGCQVAVSSTPTLVPTRGCGGTPNAFSCSIGGGCCQTGQVCTESNNQNVCSGEASIPTPSGATISSDNSLSQSSKAGIGAGVAIGAALVIGAVTWFCIRRRRTERRRRSAAYARSQQGPTPGADTTVVGSMSEVSGPTRGQRIHPSGLVYDYFGPQATEGPYTQQEGTPHETPGLAERGVPLQPHGPGDIVVPVEMGPGAESGMTAAATTRRGAALARGASTRSAATVGSASTRNRDQQQDTLYELDAGFGSPSPLSQDEARQAAQSPEEPISPGYGTLDVDHYRDTH
ncbi:hypothetical protein JX266_003944 [Neoarthrinium moseri]|nr:hypothetical protein JX266_003944 [Neoarthrinium moseri]